MAFKRIVNFFVFEPANAQNKIRQTEISNLDIEFDIIRSKTFEENTGEFIVYNANEDTRKKILKKGNNSVFEAGYDDEGIATILIGNITMARSRQIGPDWVTNINVSTIQSSKKTLVNNNIALSFAENIPVIQPLQRIASAIGMQIFGAETVSGITLSNGFVHAGSTRSALVNLKNTLKSKDIGLYADNNELILYNLATKSGRFSTVVLDYESGLLNVDDITEYDNQGKFKKKRIGVESLLIPKLQPQGLLKLSIDDPLAGVYFVDKVNTFGNNFGGDFNMNSEVSL